MDLEIGIVCGRCETYAMLGSSSCEACSSALVLEGTGPSSSKSPATTREPPPDLVAPVPPPKPPVGAPRTASGY